MVYHENNPQIFNSIYSCNIVQYGSQKHQLTINKVMIKYSGLKLLK